MSVFVATQDQRDLAETLSGYGVPQEDIARLLRISMQTLHKHFRDELDLGMAKANAFVAQNLFRQATKDDPSAVRAAIFWTKARMGWREVPQEMTVTHRTEEAVPEDRLRALALMLAKQQGSDERRPH